VGPAPLRVLPSLTGLRWVAALLVFGTHVAGLGLAARSASTGTGTSTDGGSVTARILTAVFGPGGPVGVSCFFILSGFVLTWSVRPDDSAGTFWRRRFAKIYPLYALTSLLGMLALATALGLPGPKVLLAQALMVQSWVPSQHYSLAMNPVTWSLSCEAFFYLCFPALLLLLAGARTRTLRVVAAGAVAVPFVVPWLAGRLFTLGFPVTGELVDTTPYGGPFQGWVANTLPATRLAEFVLGIVVAVLVRRGEWAGPRLPVAAALCLAGYAATHAVGGYPQLVCVTVVPLALLVGALAEADLAGRRSPLRGRVMVRLGEASYAFYLIHFLVVMGLGLQLKPLLAAARLSADRDAPLAWWQVSAAFVLLLGVSLALAWLLHRRVELPLMRRLRPRPTPTARSTVDGTAPGAATGAPDRPADPAPADPALAA